MSSHSSFLDDDTKIFGPLGSMSVLWNSLPVDVRQGILDFAIRRSNERERMTPLHLACEDGDLGLVIFLVDVAGVEKEEKDSRGETPLFNAVANRHYTTIRYLVSTARVNLYSVNNQGSTVLQTAWAFWYESDRIVRFLIEECGMAIDTPDANGTTILHLVAMNSTGIATPLVSWLVETRGANVNVADKDDSTPLHLAAMIGKLATAEVLLNHGASIEARNKKGETALYLACKCGHTEFCRVLIESWHANVHVVCPSGQGTLLHASIMSNVHSRINWNASSLFGLRSMTDWNVAMVQLLIEKGVDVYAVDDKNKQTALHWALHRPMGDASLEIAQALVQAGGDELVHAVNGWNKSTALHHASRGGRLDVVQCLVDGGDRNIPFINAENYYGDTAVDLATEHGHTDVVEFLQAMAPTKRRRV